MQLGGYESHGLILFCLSLCFIDEVGDPPDVIKS